MSPSAEQALKSPPAAFGNPRSAVALYRAWNFKTTDHFYTTNDGEFDSAVNAQGFSNEGVTCWIFPAAQTGTVPLYRLWNAVGINHYYTVSAKERYEAISFMGYVDEGITGHVYPDASGGGIPLWRLYNAATVDHYYTTSESDRDRAVGLGYKVEGNAGFVLPF